MERDIPLSNREIGLMLESQNKLNEEKFRNVDQSFAEFRRDLFDKELGYLPRIEAQTKKHNGRMTKIERVLLVVGTAVIVMSVSSNSATLHLIASLL